ncbi:hypothetical protein Tco_0381329 [Tanacetum coccineum]
MRVTYEQPLSDPSHAQGGNPSFGGTSAYYPYIAYASQAPTSNNITTRNGFMHPSTAPSNNYPFYTQPMYPIPNVPAYPNHGSTSLFANSNGCVTPIVHWIEDYPLPDILKMPSHMGSYNGKGDPYNYLHLFESSILSYEDLKAKFRSHFSQQKKFTKTHLAVHNIKQREGESTRAFVTRYTDDTLKILGLHDLPNTYTGLMERTYTWIEAKEVATNGAPNDHRESFDRVIRNSFWDNNKGKKTSGRFSPYRGSNHRLLSSLSKSPREILETENVAKTFEQPPCLIGSRRSLDMSKYCHSHEDYGHDTNQCRELRHQIKEAVKSEKLAHLIGEGQKKLKEASQEVTKDSLSCVGVEERIIVNEKYLEQTIIVGNQLPTSFKRKLWALLKANTDVFTWTYADMKGILRTIMVGGKPFNTEHMLNEFKHTEPVKQKKRGLAPERNKAICKEVKELTNANILREVKYQTWVSNLVMVKKDDGRWKLCIKFTNINKACPKDCYPLLEVDQKIESL